MSKIEKPQHKDSLQVEQQSRFPLVKANFVVMAVAALMIVAGFLLMAGAPSTETEFNPDIFSTRRIVVGPLISFLGFVAMGVGIIMPVKRKEAPADTETSTNA